MYSRLQNQLRSAKNSPISRYQLAPSRQNYEEYEALLSEDKHDLMPMGGKKRRKRKTKSMNKLMKEEDLDAIVKKKLADNSKLSKKKKGDDNSFSKLKSLVKKSFGLMKIVGNDLNKIKNDKLRAEYDHLQSVLNKFGQKELTSKSQDLDNYINDAKYLTREIKILSGKIIKQRLLKTLRDKAIFQD